MQTRISKFVSVLMIAAICFSTGAHLALLQSVAWTKMLVDYSHGGSFTEAVAKTFDGQHPCALCNVIQMSSQSEKKSDQSPVTAKIEAVVPVQISVNIPAFTRTKYFTYLSSGARVPYAPLTPPPRAA